MSLRRLLLVAIALTFSFLSSFVLATPLHIIAAENFYADVAKQVGGEYVSVSSILSNPDDNPHLFEASPTIAKSIAQAKIAIYSGIGYDSWMSKLLAGHSHLTIIDVASLIGRQDGDNPHIWYDPHTMLTFALAIKQQLIRLDPAHQASYQHNWQQFVASMHPILTDIDSLRQRYAGTEVTATEPVFGYMFAELGFKVRNLGFQMAVMNDTEPSISQMKGLHNDLIEHKVAFLLYNLQVSDPMTEQLKTLAQTHKVAIVGATETMPKGIHYQQWLKQELDAVQKVLKK
ncbi:metal ABC transporter solute-binding protein, Zn/Mn family [Celerinatantimonas yamalensis]|uniref:Zinc ABC transporter substrate-binding protein n=1 Tax=Celerinatantimonas yamalensis TaxID=559956 RepID=A0ABW9G8G0_9GAMM